MSQLYNRNGTQEEGQALEKAGPRGVIRFRGFKEDLARNTY